MGRQAVGAVSLALVAMLMSACTGGSESDELGETAPPSASDSATSGGQPTASTDPPESDHTQPLVVALNIHRAGLDLTRAEARGLADGSVTRWAQLGQPGGRLRLATGPQALRIVQSDESAVALAPASRVGPTVQVATVGGIDPLVKPDAYPLTAPADAAHPQITTMTVVGDIMLGRGVESANSGNAGRTLDPLAARLAGADLTVGNLESTLSADGQPQQPGDDSFHAAPQVVGDLVRAGFDLVSLANNHTGDYGNRALLQTLSRIDQSALGRVGAGRDAAEAWAPVVLERGGVRFGFLAFNAIGETPRATPTSAGAAEIRMQPRTGPLNERDLTRMERAIRSLRQQADVVVVLPHWGDQYTHAPVPDQRRVGRALVDAGADLVVGGHPHWVQSVDTHAGRLIAYSLGNFIFDMDFMVETQQGAMLDLVFWGDELKSARFVPYVIGPDFAPRLARGPTADGILDDIWSASGPPFRS